MSIRINVYGINKDSSIEELKDLFEQHGTVAVAELKKTSPRGYIEMANADEALKAMSKLQGKKFNDRKLRLRQASPLRSRMA